MQKFSGLTSLVGFRSLAGSTSMAMKAANPKLSSDAGGSSYGSFANLKITAEKLVKEQSSVKTNLEMEHTKLRRATEQINLLEGKLQQAVNVNAKIKVKHNEDSKLWQGLDSKISSTKTLCDQLTETLQKLASQTEQAEEDKKFFEDMLGKNSKALDEFNCLLHDLSTKLECAEHKIISGKQEMLQIKQEKEEMDGSYKEQLYSNDTLIGKAIETLDRDHASVSKDIGMMHMKLRRATEQINLLEEKLQQAVKENTKLMVKWTEDSNLWQGLALKVSSMKTFTDQLSETLKQQACKKETERDEDDKKFFYEILGRNSTCLYEFQCLLHDLSTTLESADSLIKKFEASVDKSKASLTCLDSLQYMNQHLKLKDDVSFGLKEILESTGCRKYNLDLRNQYRGLEFKKLAVRESAAVTEWQLNEAEKKYNIMAEGKQIELQEYLKEISIKNSQVITGICKYYGLEKIEITDAENQKSVKDRCSEKMSKLMSCELHCEKEHGAMVSRIQQDNEHKESTLWAYHKEELQRIQSHAENGLRKESVSLMKREDSYTRKEHELQLGVNLFGKVQSPLLNILRKINEFLDILKHGKVTNTMRSIHNTPYMGSSKRKKEPGDHNYPGNTARVILNRDDLRASQRSFKIAIRKARAWCRSKSKPVDLSAHFGPGAEVFTTPADGTFHLTFEYDNRSLTLFLYGRDLYVKGWDGDRYGLFEIVKNFIPDPTCKFLDTGVNYNHICKSGKVGKVRIGPEALIESFEVLHKCNGVVTTGLARSVAMFAVGTSEPIRLEDVFEEYLYSFDPRKIYLSELDGRKTLSDSVRNYGHLSGLYLQCVHCIQNGDPLYEILDPRKGRVISVHELRRRIKVPLRGTFDEGDFKPEDPDTEDPETPVWSPPYPDGKDWSDMVLEEEDDVRYWPPEEDLELKDEELKDSAFEDMEQEEVEDIKSHKAEMNPIKDPFSVVRSSIFRFSAAVASGDIDCIGKTRLHEGLCSGGLNIANRYQSFPIASGRITSTEVKGNTFWRPQRLSGWRMVQMATRSLKRFLRCHL